MVLTLSCLLLFIICGFVNAENVVDVANDSDFKLASLKDLPDFARGRIELPADDSVLDHEIIQWWYYTGFLDAGDKMYGFEVCFFLGEPTHPQVVHTAITDVANNKFTFDSVTEVFSKPQVIENRFNFTAGSTINSNFVTANGGDGNDALTAQIGGPGGYTLDLKLTSTKPPAIHYDGHAYKYPREAGGGYTFYYSRTSLSVTGTLTLPNNASPITVTGTSWFDRQFGNLIRVSLKGGWQWFAISLDDDTQIMLFFTADVNADTDPDREIGSMTDSSGKTIPLHIKDASLKVLDTWTSPRSGCTFPSGWEVTIQGKVYTVQPLVKDQELGPTTDEQQPWVTPIYWEGASAVTGDTEGKAYVELNGFCPR